jgi:riboflavin kinase/FMN adenylyltransferase
LPVEAPLWLPDDDARAAQLARPSVVAIGNFDGVHRGHQAILADAGREAAALGVSVCALTFDPHPSDVLGRGSPPKLTSLGRRVELLGRAGADQVVVRRFDKEFSTWEPERFARDLIAGGLHAKLVLVGEDFRFGANRTGDRAMLDTLGEKLGFGVSVCSVAGDGAGAFSSTRARAAIGAGDLPAAERVLGRRHALTGVVAHGAKLGRTIGFPTANLGDVVEMLPPDGIYAVVADEVLAPAGPDANTGVLSSRGARPLAAGALSIGVRPSIEGAVGRTVEVFLLDFDRDLYGRTLRLHLVARLREERKYPTLDELKAQIARDVEEARELTAPLVAAYGAVGPFG